MRKIVSLHGILIILLSACGAKSNFTPTIDMPALQTAAYQTAVAVVNKTATAKALIVTPEPTNTPIPSPTSTLTPTTTPLKPGGAQVFYNGISFSVDPVLGEVVSMSTILESPEYTEFSFAAEGRCQDVGCVTVYRVEAFRTYPFGDAIIDALQAAIETGSYNYFPTWGAAILLRAQNQHLRFQNGAGMRAVVMRGQNGYLANNEAVVYDFHGITDDGQYYVEVIYPIDAPILLSTYDPAENTNEGAFLVPEIPEGPPFGDMNGVMLEYNREAQRQLDTLESANFIPDLGLLDALVGSLLVTASSEN
jgi:hypothetical protein